MTQRLISMLIFLGVCSAGVAEAPPPPNRALPASFHDDALNMTYFYPAHFAALRDASAMVRAAAPCVETKLHVRSTAWSGASSFAVTSVDDKCLESLHEPTPLGLSLGPWMRTQIQRELAPLGVTTITQEPLRYLIHGQVAYITRALVAMPVTEGGSARTTYAVKACAAMQAPGVKNPGHPILCYDFTTQNSDLLSLMFAFIVQFADGPPEPLFLASAYPRR